MNIVIFENRNILTLQSRSSIDVQYLAAITKKSGYPTKSFLFENKDEKYIQSILYELDTDIIIIDFHSSKRECTLNIVDTLKKKNPRLKIVFFGLEATLNAALLMNEINSLDFIMYGECDLTITYLCDIIKNDDDPKQCEGIFYRKSGEIYRTPARSALIDLDSLPFPDLEISKNIFNDNKSPAVFFTMRTSKGCTGKCSFCIYMRKNKATKNHPVWIGRTMKNVIEEIKYVQNEFKGKRLVIEFLDASFEDPDKKEKKRIIEFLDLIEQNNLSVTFSILTKANTWDDSDYNLIVRMKELGLYLVQVGVESLSNEGLHIFNKGTNIIDIEKSMSVFKKSGVDVRTFIIMFHPYITFDQLRKNALFIKDNNCADNIALFTTNITLYPDSQLFQRIVIDGLLTTSSINRVFNFNFENGLVNRLYSKIASFNRKKRENYLNMFETINNELYLYKSWVERIDGFQTIKNEMDDYYDAYSIIKKELGDKQYNIFNNMLDLAEADTPENQLDSCISYWEDTLSFYTEKLENLRMKNKIKLSRKNIILFNT